MLYPLILAPLYGQPDGGNGGLNDFLRRGGGASDAPATAAFCDFTACTGARQARITNGEYAGMALGDLVTQQSFDLLGRHWQHSVTLPLTVRIVDVRDQVPIQVYPQQRMSFEGHVSEPSNVFWFSLNSNNSSGVAAGIKLRITRGQFVGALASQGLKGLLEVFPAPFGDAFFIPAGHVHGAGAGNLLLEVKSGQTQPLVLGNWDENQPLELPDDLQVQLLGCVRFASRQLARIRRDAREAVHTRKIPLVHVCPEFVIDEIRITDYFFDRTTGGCFHLLCPVERAFRIEAAGMDATVYPGSACLIPATLGDYRLYSAADSKNCLLRIMPNVPVL